MRLPEDTACPFDEFRVSTAPEDIGGSMTFYRHR